MALIAAAARLRVIRVVCSRAAGGGLSAVYGADRFGGQAARDTGLLLEGGAVQPVDDADGGRQGPFDAPDKELHDIGVDLYLPVGEELGDDAGQEQIVRFMDFDGGGG